MSTRIQGIDLLRGLAVALVMARHALPEVFPGAGVVGVVMFFALSGYLISGVLLTEHERTDRVDLRRFYLRRATRLVPALLVLLVGWGLVTAVADPVGGRDGWLTTVALALTWTANQPWVALSPDLFHLWTLAGEEQFYLLWPALLLLGLRRGRPVPLLVGVGAVAALACLATTVWLWESPDNAYVLPTSWALCFVLGAAGQFARRRGWRPASVVVPVVPLALVLLGTLALLPVRGTPSTYLVVGPVVAAGTVVLLLSWQDWVRVEDARLRPLVTLGTVSYAAYLWNYPLTLWLRSVEPLGWVAGPLAAVLTVGAAVLSWRLVEGPAQRWASSRWRPRERVPSC